jgi:hypothetical protein
MVNDNPVYGKDGFRLSPVTKDSVFHFDLSLGKGVNYIRVSSFNQRGAESLRQQVKVNYLPADSVHSKTYFIGIGINHFRDDKHDLQWSVKDIRDLAKALAEKSGGHFEADTLFNENVNRENVRALKERIRQAGINDRIIIAYSGHGLLSENFDYYLSTYAVNFERPEENGLPYEDLENLVDSISCRQKLILIDACHSGDLDKEEIVVSGESNARPDASGKGLRPVENKEPVEGLKNSFELMQELFAKLGNNTGATVISASTGIQFALENEDLKNGVFTYSILELLRTKTSVTISDLKQYVSARVTSLTKGKQVPTIRNETRAVDWTVW